MKLTSATSFLTAWCLSGVVTGHDAAASQQQQQRRTAIGDFAEFNTLFDNAQVVLSDTYKVSEKVGLWTLSMDLWDLKCYDISVGDIQIDHERPSNQNIDVLVDVFQLDLTCEMNYSYTYGNTDGTRGIKGDGWVKVPTDNNSASTRLSFTSPNFDTTPPTGSAVSTCDANIDITRLDFEGDTVSEIVEIFQGLVRGTIEREVGKVACAELGSLGTSFVENALGIAQEKLLPYQEPLDPNVADPLYLEKNINVPSDIVPLDFRNEENQVTKLFKTVLEGFDSFLGTAVSDSSALTGRDLAINMFMRDYFLDEDRAFTLNADQLPIESTVLFDGHDRITETMITLNKVRIFGLDTMSRFNPFMEIGSHTLQNELTWDKLTVEFDVTVDIKPSTLDDAILQAATSTGVSETVMIDFGVENVDIFASLLVVLDEKKLGSLELGPLMHTDYLLPCLLSVLHEAKLSGITMNPQEINEPTLNGFISSGIDRIVTDSVEAAFTMYNGALRDALPSIFQTTVRDLINSEVIDVYLGEIVSDECPDVDPVGEYIDFRQLFDSESNTYGDLPPMLKELMDSELLSADETGAPRINKVLIGPYSEKQSGEAGTFKFGGDFFSVESESIPQFGLEDVELRAFDGTIKNMDSFVMPIRLLSPNSTNGYVLDNIATLAPAPDSLQFGMKGLFALQGDPVLSMSNELQLSLDMASSQLIMSMLAKVDAEALSTFPLRDIISSDCWLSLLSKPLFETGDPGAKLESILLSVPGLRFNVGCSNCTSPGLFILPDILSKLEAGGVSDVVEGRLLELALELARSDYVQASLNQLVMSGAMRCPHSPDFVARDAESDYPVPDFPSLTYDVLESVAFTSTIFMHVATAVIAESHTNYDAGSTQALSGQADVRAMAGDAELIDFTTLETSIGEWADVALEQAVEYLESVVDDANSPGGEALRINKLLRDSLLDADGVMTIDFNNLSANAGDMEVALKAVRITGLDSIKTVDVLNVLGPQTIQNQVSWDKLGMEIVVSLLGSDGGSSGRNLKTLEDITLSLELADINVSMALLLAMDLDLLGNLPLSSILELKNILPCLLSGARAAKFTELDVLVGSITQLSVDGFRSPDLADAAADSSRIIMENYGDNIVSAMPGFFDLTMRALLNNWMEHYMDGGTGVACPTTSFAATRALNYVDLRDLLLPAAKAKIFGASGAAPYGDLFRTVITTARNLVFEVDETSGLSRANEVIVGPLTREQSGTTGILDFPGELLSGGTRLQVGGLDATIQMSASNARIENLDTVGAPLTLLENMMEESYELNNTASFGIGNDPVRIAVRVMLSFVGEDGTDIRNELDVALDMASANVVARTMMKIAESRFYAFPLRDILDLNCWAAMIPAPRLDARGLRLDGLDPNAALSNLIATIASLNLNVKCVECSSPRMGELTELLSSPDTQSDVTDVANLILEYSTELLEGSFLQVQIDRFLSDAERQCPHRENYDPDFTEAVFEPIEAPAAKYATSFLILLGCVTVALALIVGVIMLGVRWIVQRRHRRWLGNLPPHQVKTLIKRQRTEDEEESALNARTQSMFTSPIIPCFVRWLMPVIVVGNILFFLSGHLSLGATVNIDAELAGEEFRIEQFFEFSMAKSTIDIWNAGGRELAVLILVFSGIWPYTKQFITLALWFTPPSRVSVSRRGSILLWLDWLAKWSMVDIFVLVISIAAFRVSISSPKASFLPQDFYTIDMMVVPLWGLYANMIAQLISQVSSHFVIHYHRQIVKHASQSEEGDEDSLDETRGSNDNSGKDVPRLTLDVAPDANSQQENSNTTSVLRKHPFTRPHRGETEKVVVRSGVNPALAIAGLLLIACVIFGCVKSSFSLELLGILGVAVEFGQDFEDASTEHSIFTVIQLLFEEANFLDTVGDYVGLGTLSVLLVLTVLVVPILQSLTLVHQWCTATTRAKRARAAIILETMQAWQYAEVYLMAVFVASWQLGPVSEFMINSYCDNLKDTFASLVYYGILKEEDAQCFSVRSSIEGGSYLLAGGAILLALLNTFVTKAITQYFREKDEVARRSLEDKQSDTTFDSEDDSESGGSTRVHPVPVLFTDTFRWFLRPELASSSRALFMDSARSSEWDFLPEATAIPDDGGLIAQYPSGGPLDEKSCSSSVGTSSQSRLSPKVGKRLTYGEPMEPRRDFKSDSLSPRGSLKQPPGSYKSEKEQRSMGLRSGAVKKQPTIAAIPSDATVATQLTTAAVPSDATVATQVTTDTRGSRRSVPQPLVEELSVEERQTLEEVLDEDANSTMQFSSAESEFVEETVDEFEECTVEESLMSDIPEEYYEEELSRADTRSGRSMV